MPPNAINFWFKYSSIPCPPSRPTPHSHELPIYIKQLTSKELTNSTLLHPPKRYSRVTDHPRVRRHHPHLERLRDAPYPSHVPTEKVPCQPDVGVISHRDNLFLSVELDEGGDGAKRFLLRKEGGGGYVREDGREVEGADAFSLGVVGRVAADEDVGAERDSVVDVSGNFGDGAVVDERAVCPVRVSAMCVHIMI
jgi:hypothetical protein